MLARLMSRFGWVLCLAILAGWLVDAVHRGQLVAMLITATGVVGLAVVPVLHRRLQR